MFNDNGFIKAIARLVLAAFLYSFVVFEPLYGVTTLEKSAAADNTAAEALNTQLGTMVLSARQGRISDGCYVSHKSRVTSLEKGKNGSGSASRLETPNSRLVIFIQDLHCNPEVQKNISEILSFFDTKYGLKKIFLEGAPAGKADLSLFTGITDPAIKEKTLESLLGEGLLSGAVYYGAKNNKENIFGLEQWNLYKENVARMSALLSSKSGSDGSCAELNNLLEQTMALHASSRLKVENYRIKEAEKSKDKYKQFAEIAHRAGISLVQYPNLWRQTEAGKLNAQIKFKRLPKDLQAFLKDIQEKTPYGVYKTIAAKLGDNNRDGEFYLNLQEVAQVYAPELLMSHRNVGSFLEYVRLNYAVNPMCLVEEEGQFKQEVLNSRARTLVDSELVFMQAMTDMLSGFVALGMTPRDFGYFKEHAEQYKLDLMKYYGTEKTSAVLKILENKELYSYYDVNLQRNQVFAKELLGTHSGLRTPDFGLSVVNEYTEVIKHLGEFAEIDAVVTGGFHVETAKALKEQGVSYLTITPNVTRKTTGDLYERFMTAQLNPKDFGISALAGRYTVPEFVAKIGKVAADAQLPIEELEKVLQNSAGSIKDGKVTATRNGDSITVTMQREDEKEKRSVTFTRKADGTYKEDAAEWKKVSASADPNIALTTQSTIEYAKTLPFFGWLLNSSFTPFYVAGFILTSWLVAPWKSEIDDFHEAIYDDWLAVNMMEDHAWPVLGLLPRGIIIPFAYTIAWVPFVGKYITAAMHMAYNIAVSPINIITVSAYRIFAKDKPVGHIALTTDSNFAYSRRAIHRIQTQQGLLIYDGINATVQSPDKLIQHVTQVAKNGNAITVHTQVYKQLRSGDQTGGWTFGPTYTFDVTNGPATVPSTIRKQKVDLAWGVKVSKLGTEGQLMAMLFDKTAYGTWSNPADSPEKQFKDKSIKGAQWWNGLKKAGVDDVLSKWNGLTPQARQVWIGVYEKDILHGLNFEKLHVGADPKSVKGTKLAALIAGETYSRHFPTVNVIANVAEEIAAMINDTDVERKLTDEDILFVIVAMANVFEMGFIINMRAAAEVMTHAFMNLVSPEDQHSTVGNTSGETPDTLATGSNLTDVQPYAKGFSDAEIQRLNEQIYNDVNRNNVRNQVTQRPEGEVANEQFFRNNLTPLMQNLVAQKGDAIRAALLKYMPESPDRERLIVQVLNTLPKPSTFAWFNAIIEGPGRFLIGLRAAPAIDLAWFLYDLDRADTDGINNRLEAYLLHKVIESVTDISHSDNVALVSEVMGWQTDDRGFAPLGSAIHQFINERAATVLEDERSALQAEKQSVKDERNAQALTRAKFAGRKTFDKIVRFIDVTLFALLGWAVFAGPTTTTTPTTPVVPTTAQVSTFMPQSANSNLADLVLSMDSITSGTANPGMGRNNFNLKMFFGVGRPSNSSISGMNGTLKAVGAPDGSMIPVNGELGLSLDIGVLDIVKLNATLGKGPGVTVDLNNGGSPSIGLPITIVGGGASVTAFETEKFRGSFTLNMDMVSGEVLKLLTKDGTVATSVKGTNLGAGIMVSGNPSAFTGVNPYATFKIANESGEGKTEYTSAGFITVPTTGKFSKTVWQVGVGLDGSVLRLAAVYSTDGAVMVLAGLGDGYAWGEGRAIAKAKRIAERAVQDEADRVAEVARLAEQQDLAKQWKEQEAENQKKAAEQTAWQAGIEAARQEAVRQEQLRQQRENQQPPAQQPPAQQSEPAPSNNTIPAAPTTPATPAPAPQIPGAPAGLVPGPIPGSFILPRTESERASLAAAAAPSEEATTASGPIEDTILELHKLHPEWDFMDPAKRLWLIAVYENDAVLTDGFAQRHSGYARNAATMDKGMRLLRDVTQKAAAMSMTPGNVESLSAFIAAEIAKMTSLSAKEVKRLSKNISKMFYMHLEIDDLPALSRAVAHYFYLLNTKRDAWLTLTKDPTALRNIGEGSNEYSEESVSASPLPTWVGTLPRLDTMNVEPVMDELSACFAGDKVVPEKALLFLDKYNKAIADPSQPVNLQTAPVEAVWPVLKAIVFLDKPQALQLVALIRTMSAKAQRQPTLLEDTIRLMEHDIANDWADMNASHLDGRTILYNAAELSYPVGGLSAVGLYHTLGIKILLAKAKKVNVNIVAAEPWYQMQRIGTEHSPLDYQAMGATSMVAIDDVFEFDMPYENKYKQPITVHVKVSKGVDKDGNVRYLVRDVNPDGSSYYTKYVYDYNTEHNPVSGEEFNGFWCKATAMMYYVLEKQRKQELGDKWKRAIVWAQDGQVSPMVAVIETMQDEAEYWIENEFRGLGGLTPEDLRGLAPLTVDTTHTYPNRNNIIYADSSKADGINREAYNYGLWAIRGLLKVGAKFLGFFLRENDKMFDSTSGGARPANLMTYVSDKHRKDFVRKGIDPTMRNNSKAITNGGNKGMWRFTQIMRKLFGDNADLDRPTPDMIRQSKVEACRELNDMHIKTSLWEPSIYQIMQAIPNELKQNGYAKDNIEVCNKLRDILQPVMLHYTPSAEQISSIFGMTSFSNPAEVRVAIEKLFIEQQFAVVVADPDRLNSGCARRLVPEKAGLQSENAAEVIRWRLAHGEDVFPFLKVQADDDRSVMMAYGFSKITEQNKYDIPRWKVNIPGDSRLRNITPLRTLEREVLEENAESIRTTGKPKYTGRLCVVLGFNGKEKNARFAASNVGEKFSYDETGAAEESEESDGDNAALKTGTFEGVIMFCALLIKKVGKLFVGRGNAIAPERDDPESARKVHEQFIELWNADPRHEQFYSFSANSVRLARIQDYLLTSAAYIRTFDELAAQDDMNIEKDAALVAALGRAAANAAWGDIGIFDQLLKNGRNNVGPYTFRKGGGVWKAGEAGIEGFKERKLEVENAEGVDALNIQLGYNDGDQSFSRSHYADYFKTLFGGIKDGDTDVSQIIEQWFDDLARSPGSVYQKNKRFNALVGSLTKTLRAARDKARADEEARAQQIAAIKAYAELHGSMVITVDGTSGAGKGTAAQLLADKLGFIHLDAGAIYRMFTVLAMQEKIPFNDGARIVDELKKASFDVIRAPDGTVGIRLNGRDISSELRTPQVGSNVAAVAKNRVVSEYVFEFMRILAKGKNIVADGRNMGTDTFPAAPKSDLQNRPVKFYVDAPVDVRAQRRHDEFVRANKPSRLEDVKNDIAARDQADMSRDFAPLRKASDAHTIDSSNLSPEQVVSQMLEVAASKIAAVFEVSAPFAALYHTALSLKPATIVAKAVREILTQERWVANLPQIADKGIVLLATTPEQLKISLEQAGYYANLGVPVTLMSTIDAGFGETEKPLLVDGKVTVGGDAALKGITLEPVLGHNNGSRQFTVIKVSLASGYDATGVTGESLVVAASNALAREVGEGGILQGPLGGVKICATMINGSPEFAGLKAALAAAKGSARDGRVVAEWETGKTAQQTLENIQAKYSAENNAMQDKFVEDMREAKEPMVALASGRFDTVSGPLEGTYPDEIELAKPVRGIVSTLFFGARRPDSVDPLDLDPAAADLGRFIDGLYNNGVLGKDDHAALTNRLLPIRRNGQTDTLTMAMLTRIRTTKTDVATTLGEILRKNGYTADKLDITDGKSLIRSISLLGMQRSAAAMQQPGIGITRGWDIGVVTKNDADKIMQALEWSQAVRFNTEALSTADAEYLFKQIKEKRTLAIRAGNKALKDAKLVTVTAPANVRVATECLIHSQLKADGALTADQEAAVKDYNAAVVVETQDQAKLALSAKVSEIVASFNGYSDDGVKLIDAATAGNWANIKDILGLFSKGGAFQRNAIMTPEGRFYAGARASDELAKPLLTDKTAADIVLEANREGVSKLAESVAALEAALSGANKTPGDITAAMETIEQLLTGKIAITGDAHAKTALRGLLTSVRTIRDDGSETRLQGYRAYGMLSAFIGNALLINLTEGEVDYNDIANHVPLRNLLAQAYMQGVSVKQMRESLKNGVETTGDGKGLRSLLTGEKSVEFVSYEIETHFQRPVIVTGEKFQNDWLALAASAMLFPLIAELRKPNSDRMLKDSVAPATKYMVEMLSAA